jgi:pyruvate,water dikinase
VSTTKAFVPPAPGAWELERTHVTRPCSILMEQVFPPNMMKGFSEGTRYYGVLLDYLDVAIINRFVYMAPRPAGAPKTAKGTPPKFVFKLLQTLNPELRRRIKRSSEIWQQRAWRNDLKWWHEEVKPAVQAEAQALLAEDIASIPDAQLVDHVRRAVDFFGRTTYWHHRFNCCVMIPTGDFLTHAIEWTGLTPDEILRAFRGASPVSAGATDELGTLRHALRSDPAALALVASNGDPAAILSQLRARPAPVGPAAAAYLDLVGLRVLGGYDIADEHAQEHPDMLLKILRAAGAQDDPVTHAKAEEALEKVRARVPAAHRAEFDQLLEEARATYSVRDERIFYGDGLGAGVARRALLEAGSRLVRQHRLTDRTHVVDMTLEETIGALEGKPGPSAQQVAERVRFRLETSLDKAPPFLGFPPSAPPPVEWLPSGAARLQRAFATIMGQMFASCEQQASTKTLKGFSASPGTYEGKARVIQSIGELPAVQAGEVLVTRSTGSTYNVILPLIGAIVTERGGALSHAAIVAREYGLPAVVGCGGATGAITTGMRVRVDGDRGEVRVLE